MNKYTCGTPIMVGDYIKCVQPKTDAYHVGDICQVQSVPEDGYLITDRNNCLYSKRWEFVKRGVLEKTKMRVIRD